MSDFINSTKDLEDSFITPPNLFEKQKPLISIVNWFFDRSENKLKELIQKFDELSNKKSRLSIKRIT